MTTIFNHNGKDYQINTEQVLFGKNKGQFVSTIKGMFGFIAIKPLRCESIDEVKRSAIAVIDLQEKAKQPHNDIENSELWD